MTPSAHQRVLRATAATLSWQPLGADGDPTDPGTVTVAVTASDGTVVKAALTATSGTGSSPRTVALTAAETANLDRLTAVWTVTGTAVATTRVDIVGGFYFSAAELRAAEPSLADQSRDTTAKIYAARAEVELTFEAHGRPAFVPRFAVERFTPGAWTGRLTLSGWPFRQVRWVRQWYPTGTSTVPYLDYTVDELAAVYLDERADRAVFPSWFTEYETVQIGYEYGFDAIGADGKAQAMTLARSVVNRHRSGMPDRAVSMTSPEGTTFQLGRVGTSRRPTGIDSVDEFLTRPEFRRVCLA